MKEDTLRKVIGFFFDYLWLVCGLMISVSFVSTLLTAYTLMQNAAKDSLSALSMELSHRIAVNFDLLEGLKELPQLKDTSIPVQDRAFSLSPFAKSFDLWMIGVVDPDGMIASTRDYGAAQVERDYIPRIVASGQREMSDIFPAGATGDLNFSQFVPIKNQDKVVSIVFTATLLTHVDQLLLSKEYQSSGYYLLLDGTLNVISHPSEIMREQSIQELSKSETFFRNRTQKTFLADLKSGVAGDYVSWFKSAFYFTAYTPIVGTQLTLIHRVRLIQTFQTALWGFSLQAAVYLLVFSGLYLLGTRYISRKLAPVDNILKQVIDLNKTIHNTDTLSDEDAQMLMHISRKGLRDELTELPTRMLFRQMLNITMQKLTEDEFCAIFFIDMDNLKNINDALGHEYGDLALKSLSAGLRTVSTRHDGLCSRHGGDEFMLFIAKLHSQEEACAIADELLDTLHGSVGKDEKQRSFHASIGIALYPLHAKSIDVVIQLADIALYEAKQNGKGGYAMYTPEKIPTDGSSPAGPSSLREVCTAYLI